MPKRLVIDDVRVPMFPAKIARTAIEALEMIKAESWDEVWLDHDADFVSGQDYSWTTARVRDLCKKGQAPDVGLFVMHSANTQGRKWMREHLMLWYPIVQVEEYPEKGLLLSGEGKVWDVSTDRGVHRNLSGKGDDELWEELRTWVQERSSNA
jgi:hypothetical protein